MRVRMGMGMGTYGRREVEAGCGEALCWGFERDDGHAEGDSDERRERASQRMTCTKMKVSRRLLERMSIVRAHQ